MSESGVRYSSRAPVLDRQDRVLLAEHTTSDGVVWVGPGGGVEDGESLTDALARELCEEARLQIRPDADPTMVWIQRHNFGFGEWTTIQNHFFLLRSEDFESISDTPETVFPLDPGLVSMRWWAPTDIEDAANDPAVLFSPRAFPRLWVELLGAARLGQLPGEPSWLAE